MWNRSGDLLSIPQLTSESGIQPAEAIVFGFEYLNTVLSPYSVPTDTHPLFLLLQKQNTSVYFTQIQRLCS